MGVLGSTIRIRVGFVQMCLRTEWELFLLVVPENPLKEYELLILTFISLISFFLAYSILYIPLTDKP